MVYTKFEDHSVDVEEVIQEDINGCDEDEERKRRRGLELCQS